MKSRIRLWGWMGMIPGLLVACACRQKMDQSLPPVRDFQIARYMGLWYETARTPNPFEKGMVSVTAFYSLKGNGTVQVENRGIRNGKFHRIRGIAKVRSKPDEGDLLVSFFRPFYSLYRIVLLGKEYQYSVVMSSGGKYLWILSREKELSPADRAEILAFLKGNFPAADSLIWNGPVYASPEPVPGRK